MHNSYIVATVGCLVFSVFCIAKILQLFELSSNISQITISNYPEADPKLFKELKTTELKKINVNIILYLIGVLFGIYFFCGFLISEKFFEFIGVLFNHNYGIWVLRLMFFSVLALIIMIVTLGNKAERLEIRSGVILK